MTDAPVSTALPKRVLGVAIVAALAVGFGALLYLHPWKMLPSIALSLLSCPTLVMGLWPGIWIRRRPGPPDACHDLARRRPVWSVLSELYLDTELSETDHARISAVLIESRYSVDELEEILYRELHPTLHSNLLSMTGEWAGFDEGWLEEKILDRGPRRKAFAIVPGKWMVRGDWKALQARLARAER